MCQLCVVEWSSGSLGKKGLMSLRRKDLVVSKELWWDMRVW